MQVMEFDDNSGDQTHYVQLVQQLNEFRKKDLFHDCIIYLKNGDTIKVHRVILATMSHLLKCIFQYDYDANRSKSNSNCDYLNKCNSNVSLGNADENPGAEIEYQQMSIDSDFNNDTSIGIGDTIYNHFDLSCGQNRNFAPTDKKTSNIANLPKHNCIEIRLNVSFEIMSLMIEYAYTGTCDITWTNIEELLASANEYEIVGLIKLCTKFLEKHLAIDNCIGIYVNAKQYFCKELLDNTKLFILQNFEKLTKSSNTELLDITYDEFYEILVDDYLNIENEETVFYVIQNWIMHDTQNRVKYLGDLIKTLRFGFITKDFCNNVLLKWNVLNTDSNLIDKLKLLSALYSRGGSDDDDMPSRHAQLNANDPQLRPRVPNEIVFVVGGWTNGSTTNIIETYDPRAKLWLMMNCTEFKRAYHGVVAIENKMYVLGGFDGDVFYNTVKCYDPATYTWEDRACMNFRRCYISVVNNGNKIYAMGGYNGHHRLDSVEMYDPKKNQWELMASMFDVRSDAGSTTVGDYIFIAGGFNGVDVLNSCEMYNVKTNKWTYIKFLENPRSGSSLIHHNNILYAIGGNSAYHRLTSVERYNLSTQTWEQDSNMITPRSNFATVVLGNTIYVMGGFNGTHTINYTESYTPDAVGAHWIVEKKMITSRSALGACKLTNLSNMKDYSFYSREIVTAPCYIKKNDVNENIFDSSNVHSPKGNAEVSFDQDEYYENDLIF